MIFMSFFGAQYRQSSHSTAGGCFAYSMSTVVISYDECSLLFNAHSDLARFLGGLQEIVC